MPLSTQAVFLAYCIAHGGAVGMALIHLGGMPPEAVAPVVAAGVLIAFRKLVSN